MIRASIMLIISICALPGCATSPVPFQKATPVSESNFLEGYVAFSQPVTGSVRVIVVRDSGMLGAAVPAKLSVNGHGVAKLWSSQRIELFMPPAVYIFSVEPSPRLGGALVERDISIAEENPHAFRIALDGGGAFSLQASTQLE